MGDIGCGGAPAEGGPSRGAEGNLPLEPDAFVGRAAELDELSRALDASRLVTVTGPGGVGKSRLAARASARRAPRDGVWRVELAALGDAEFVDHVVVEALGLTDHTARLPRETLRSHLAERRLLLVLDGFEHLVDACADLVADLLRRAPGLRVLAVGRRALSVAGERLVPLAPLGEEEAVRLLAVRAGQHAAGAGDEGQMRELCRRLDGIPLAIELAAGRLDALSPEQVLERLGDRFRLLTGGGRDALPRHRTLRTAIGWSHELCTPEERLLWARLSVFAGHFDLEAAEYVCGGNGLAAGDVLDVLSALLAQSVVTREETPAGVRYRMLDTLRAYGAEWLEGVGDAERLARRHRDWYVGLATWCELDWFSPRQREIAARVEADLPNLRRALEVGLTDPDEAHLGQHLAGSLWFSWVGCGRLAEGRHWLEQAVRIDSGHERPRLKALWVLAHVAILQGDTVPALAALRECRRRAERAADPTALAYAEHRAGCLALVTDDVSRAETLLRSALERYDGIGELNSNVLMARIELAMARAFHGALPDAVRMCEDVRRVCEEHGERWARTYALYVLAYAAWCEGDPAGARELLTDCLDGAHGFSDLLGSVLALELLALVTVTEGSAAEAAVLQGAADRMWPSVGLRLFGSAHYNTPHELCEARAREHLGDERYEERVRRGARLGRDEAVRRALRGSGAAVAGPAPGGGGRRAAAGASTQEPAAPPAREGGGTAG
ncbi:ATP-binding protein [Streptomyces prasinopilosus]|uniref:Predicted ATPase n=1 Tax=Streptomyces prasinopilosus TaxID=67344 RepID=A0A1G7A8J8_9ACTN|nr:AAA family ATPase [Streptomyces prasinopilosus]SDE11100.1 Predicted ATPase [Streptomyces prasinopilosus]